MEKIKVFEDYVIDFKSECKKDQALEIIKLKKRKIEFENL